VKRADPTRKLALAAHRVADADDDHQIAVGLGEGIEPHREEHDPEPEAPHRWAAEKLGRSFDLFA